MNSPVLRRTIVAPLQVVDQDETQNSLTKRRSGDEIVSILGNASLQDE
jgi:hypothetical protein